jgi:hypothetical protein
MVDPDHDWLSREWLELHVMVNIAHGRAAEDWPISTTPLLPRFRALKDAIDSRNLKVLPGTPGNPNANFMSRASLSNLCTFAYAGVRRDDPSSACLRDFLERSSIWLLARVKRSGGDQEARAGADQEGTDVRKNVARYQRAWC